MVQREMEFRGFEGEENRSAGREEPIDVPVLRDRLVNEMEIGEKCRKTDSLNGRGFSGFIGTRPGFAISGWWRRLTGWRLREDWPSGLAVARIRNRTVTITVSTTNPQNQRGASHRPCGRGQGHADGGWSGDDCGVDGDFPALNAC